MDQFTYKLVISADYHQEVKMAFQNYRSVQALVENLLCQALEYTEPHFNIYCTPLLCLGIGTLSLPCMYRVQQANFLF
jgi:hypothetical protein